MSTPHTFEPTGEWAAELANCSSAGAGPAMGGPEALAKFKASGRLNARERIAALLDADSFRELGSLAGKGHYSREGVFERIDPTNAIVGTGRIQGRKVALHVDDFTIRAGSSEGHDRRQVDLHRAPGAPVAHAAGAAGGLGRRQRQAADADRRHQDPRVPQLAGQ
jgi:acetyl-CoA carboxylase carboxyltransferase component